MDVETVELFTSLLALLALAGAVVLAVARLIARRGGPARRLVDVVDDSALWLAFVVAGSSMAGSLYFSEVADFVPCRLCWYQRVAMYSSAVILLVAAIRRDRSVRWYVGPLAGLGALVSSYHYLIEWKPELEGGGACGVEASCTDIWFRELGFVTLAFMALCGFLAILVLVVPGPPAPPSPLSQSEVA
ncbi:MAG: disulfide bond formation protein B [Ilumatobacteraceae bacterium]